MMTLEQQVRQAKSPLDALLILARALDARQAEPSLDTWAGWAPDETPAAPTAGGNVPPPPVTRLRREDLTDDVVKSWIAREYRNGAMVEDGTPEARVVIEQVRQDLLSAPDVQQVEDLFRTTTTGVVESDIDWSPLTDKHREARRVFAERVLQLDIALGPAPPGERPWSELYASGGPMWFYIPNRDLVLQYPESVRSQMVADVGVTAHARMSPQLADKVTHEFGGDLLRKPMSTDIEGRGAPQPVGMREQDLL